MKSIRLFAALFITLAVTAACGLKGDLYLPTEENATDASQTVEPAVEEAAVESSSDTEVVTPDEESADDSVAAP